MREINIETFKSDQDSERVPVLFDVRNPHEFAEGHVPGARNIPLDQVNDRLSDFSTHQDQEIYLICRSGGRSGQAGRILDGHGYRTVNIMGGTMGWINAGYPVEN